MKAKHFGVSIVFQQGTSGCIYRLHLQLLLAVSFWVFQNRSFCLFFLEKLRCTSEVARQPIGLRPARWCVPSRPLLFGVD